MELSRFKSFGSTTSIPLLPGFTTVSGPNGSGKSNILDALLFALGLASSRGMRAERLPDLVNHNKQNGNGGPREARVTVTFDLNDLKVDTEEEDRELDIVTTEAGDKELTISRRLRIGKEGNYASTFSLNGKTCTQGELHEQLQRLRIYPEGYNVVLQGDVTRIITMNTRERREIVDELAGVAAFDRKIDRAKLTLENVREREDRCRILEDELLRHRDRAASEAKKAEKYQKLKAQLQIAQQAEGILSWRALVQRDIELQRQIARSQAETERLGASLTASEQQLTAATAKLEKLNQQVKALGEEEHLQLSSQLASQQAQRDRLVAQTQDLQARQADNVSQEARAVVQVEAWQQELQQTHSDRTAIEAKFPELDAACEAAHTEVQTGKAAADRVAAEAEAWVQQQTALSQQATELQEALSPLRSERAQLTERAAQLQRKTQESRERLEALVPEQASKQAELNALETQVEAAQTQVQAIAQELAAVDEERNLQQATQLRLQKELREKQRQLDKLEATNQAQKEAQGTYASQVILQSGLDGVCGLVAQLGNVEPRYQLALETAAGGRLANIVVETDRIAAAGIELLKRERAGRATFLPLNKIRAPRAQTAQQRYVQGFIDIAANLVACDPRYEVIFAYVFGGTVVFSDLESARAQLGKFRIVTLDGDLLEASGAMSGGSRSKQRGSIHFGSATASSDSSETQELRTRLADLERLLVVSDRRLVEQTATSKRLGQQLERARQDQREQRWRAQQLEQDLQRHEREREQLAAQQRGSSSEQTELTARLEVLATEIPTQETQLQSVQEQLATLEGSQTHSQWQAAQGAIAAAEGRERAAAQARRDAENQVQTLAANTQSLTEKIALQQQRQEEFGRERQALADRAADCQRQQAETETAIAATQAGLEKLAQRLGQTKQERDLAEADLRKMQERQQQTRWRQEQLATAISAHQQARIELRQQRHTQEAELPLLEAIKSIAFLPPRADASQRLVEPEITESGGGDRLAELQQQVRQLQKRLQALEPVNMLAL
ncbi:MAG: chromosome segregation protein SMC, partial [Cyanobacteria bacterium J06641_5]